MDVVVVSARSALDHGAINAAIDRAALFLMCSQRHGWWRDFDTLAGSSDEWVTAYVARAIALARPVHARPAARHAWQRLRARRWWSAGWGYNARVPRDSDSTLWALAFAETIGACDHWRARRARAWISRHVRDDGGIPTYPRTRAIRLYTRVPAAVSFDGWCSAHVCVTALAASLDLPESGRILAFVRRSQSVDGSWPSYWWCDPEYSTALAVRSLVRRGGAADASLVTRAARWAKDRTCQTGCVSPFTAALRLQILCLALRHTSQEPGDSEVELVRQLLASQLSDGSWPASARLRIPSPSECDPDRYRGWRDGWRGGGGIVTDAARLYTTATALLALTALTRSEHLHA